MSYFPIDRCVLFLSLCSYPGCVQSISDLMHGLLCSYPGHVQSISNLTHGLLCSYPGRVRSISNLTCGLPQSTPLYACGWDFYIFCMLFGDPVINWYLQDINVLWSLCFWSYSMLFILVFSYFILCHWCLCAWLSVFWDNWFLFLLPLSVMELLF